MNEKKIDEFWARRSRVADPRIATHFKLDDAIVYDLELARQHARPGGTVLDLGCGTCAMSNALVDVSSRVVAVDKQPGFLRHCADSPKLETVHLDIRRYFAEEERFDLILIFGVMNYINEQDSLALYERCSKMLAPGGTLLLKHACGVEGDVVVDKYSEEIGDWYVATYRHVVREVELLSRFFTVDVVDIYPPHLNRWENTHFYAFVARVH